MTDEQRIERANELLDEAASLMGSVSGFDHITGAVRYARKLSSLVLATRALRSE